MCRDQSGAGSCATGQCRTCTTFPNLDSEAIWRIDCDDDGFTWERRWPGRKPVVEHVAWDRITRVCWECGEWLCMDNFYFIADHEDREWVVPSGALNYQRLVDVLDRKGMFPTET